MVNWARRIPVRATYAGEAISLQPGSPVESLKVSNTCFAVRCVGAFASKATQIEKTPHECKTTEKRLTQARTLIPSELTTPPRTRRPALIWVRASVSAPDLGLLIPSCLEPGLSPSTRRLSGRLVPKARTKEGSLRSIAARSIRTRTGMRPQR